MALLYGFGEPTIRRATPATDRHWQTRVRPSGYGHRMDAESMRQLAPG